MFDLKTILFVIIPYFFLKAQQNYNYENFGNKSILLNGNVTGSVSDLGASYYNPARLTTLANSLLEINAKVYQFQKVKLDNIFGERSELDDTNFGSIPRMIAGAFTIKGLEGNIFAYTLLTKRNGTFSTYHETLNQGNQGNETIAVNSLRLENKVIEEWYGLSWAKAFGRNWSLGASLFYAYYDNSGKSTFRIISKNNDSEVSIYEKVAGYRTSSYGFYPIIGGSYLKNETTFGINISFPHIQLKGKGEIRYEEYLAASNPEEDFLSYNNLQDLASRHKYPLGIQIGAGIPWQNSILHAKVGWHSPLRSYSLVDLPPNDDSDEHPLPSSLDVKLKSVLNFGLGWEQLFNENLKGYASFSTDFSPFEYNASIFDLIGSSGDIMGTNPNYYHFGLGSTFNIKGIGLSAGMVYTRGKSRFQSPTPRLLALDERSVGTSRLITSRFRFLFGLDVKLFRDKINEIAE